MASSSCARFSRSTFSMSCLNLRKLSRTLAGIGQVIETVAPGMRYELAIQDQAVGTVDRQRLDAELLAQRHHAGFSLRSCRRSRWRTRRLRTLPGRRCRPSALPFRAAENPGRAGTRRRKDRSCRRPRLQCRAAPKPAAARSDARRAPGGRFRYALHRPPARGTARPAATDPRDSPRPPIRRLRI